MSIYKAIEYGNSILEQLIIISSRMFAVEEKEEQRVIARAAMADMLNYLRSVKLPERIPFAPSHMHLYGQDMPIFSRLQEDILTGHYRRACWKIEDMLRYAQDIREPFYLINQYRCLLEKWAGVDCMPIFQRPVYTPEGTELDHKGPDWTFQYAMNKVKELFGESDVDKALLAMQMIKNDIKFSSITNIMRENFIRPGQAVTFIPFLPDKLTEVESITIDSAHTDVVITPYDTEKFFGAVKDMLHSPYDSGLNYHDGVYWPELDLAVMRDGIHHSAIGMTRGEVITLKADVIPLMPWFGKVQTDGVTWVVQDGDTIKTYDVLDFRFAMLFELAKQVHELTTKEGA